MTEDDCQCYFLGVHITLSTQCKISFEVCVAYFSTEKTSAIRSQIPEKRKQMEDLSTCNVD